MKPSASQLKTTVQISATIPIPLNTLMLKVLTVNGLPKVPKGSVSQFLATIIEGYMVKEFGADSFSLLSYISKYPDASREEIKKHFSELSNGK